MTNDILAWLLAASVAVSVALALISAGELGRNLADLEYQRASGTNGIRTIQAWRNVRTHGNRVFLAVSFIVISVLLMAGAPEVWRMWTNRVLFVLVPLFYLISSILDWHDDGRQLWLSLASESRSQVSPPELPALEEEISS